MKKTSKITQEQAKEKVRELLKYLLGINEIGQALIKKFILQIHDTVPVSPADLIITLIKANIIGIVNAILDVDPHLFYVAVKKYRIVWEAVSDDISISICCQKPIRPELRDFVAFAMRYPEEKPKRANLLTNTYRDYCLAAATYFLEREGYYPIMHNEATYEKNQASLAPSALDIVSGIYYELTDEDLKHNSIKKFFLKLSDIDKKFLNLKLEYYLNLDFKNTKDLESAENFLFKYFIRELMDKK